MGDGTAGVSKFSPQALVSSTPDQKFGAQYPRRLPASD
jgi:hypothetical protein